MSTMPRMTHICKLFISRKLLSKYTNILAPTIQEPDLKNAQQTLVLISHTKTNLKHTTIKFKMTKSSS